MSPAESEFEGFSAKKQEPPPPPGPAPDLPAEAPEPDLPAEAPEPPAAPARSEFEGFARKAGGSGAAADIAAIGGTAAGAFAAGGIAGRGGVTIIGPKTFGQRMASSIAGVFVGLGLIVLSFVVIYFTETRVERAPIVRTKTARIDPAAPADGFVKFTAKPDRGEPVTTPNLPERPLFYVTERREIYGLGSEKKGIVAEASSGSEKDKRTAKKEWKYRDFEWTGDGQGTSVRWVAEAGFGKVTLRPPRDAEAYGAEPLYSGAPRTLVSALRSAAATGAAAPSPDALAATLRDAREVDPQAPAAQGRVWFQWTLAGDAKLPSPPVENDTGTYAVFRAEFTKGGAVEKTSWYPKSPDDTIRAGAIAVPCATFARSAVERKLAGPFHNAKTGQDLTFYGVPSGTRLVIAGDLGPGGRLENAIAIDIARDDLVRFQLSGGAAPLRAHPGDALAGLEAGLVRVTARPEVKPAREAFPALASVPATGPEATALAQLAGMPLLYLEKRVSWQFKDGTWHLVDRPQLVGRVPSITAGGAALDLAGDETTYIGLRTLATAEWPREESTPVGTLFWKEKVEYVGLPANGDVTFVGKLAAGRVLVRYVGPGGFEDLARRIENPGAEPFVGAQRVEVTGIPWGVELTVVGECRGGTIASGSERPKDFLLIAAMSEKALVDALATEDAMVKWLGRVAMFVLLWIGQMLVLGPLTALLGSIPWVGDFLGGATSLILGLVTGLLAFALTLLTVLLIKLWWAILIGLALLIAVGSMRGRKAATPAGASAAVR